jgi:Response regulator containing a CheY-like receiver domain and an HTH DNA-binding domain
MTNATRSRILVVEDDPASAGVIEKTLQRFGYEIAGVFASGDDAVSETLGRKPDLVLMDIGLNGSIDGAEAARRIRLETGCPVVFLTSHFDPAVLRRAKEVEPYGYVLKPYRPEQLFVTIELALSRHHLETDRATLQPSREVADAALRELHGMLPICAGCRKVNETDGDWTKLEDYIAAHASIEFTHGMCPDCQDRLYGTHSRTPIRPERIK